MKEEPKHPAWVEMWLGKHTDAFHPGTRDECEHCQEMIKLFGPMPPRSWILEAEEKIRRYNAPEPKKQPIPDAIRWAVWERDNFTCQKCGARKRLSVDHIHPESHGGTLDLDNLQTLCRSCNSRKGNRFISAT